MQMRTYFDILCESAGIDPILLDEKAPPGKKAKSFIRKRKKDFQDRYGDAWKQVLYATAWKLFG